jgi:hypothetical protein
MTGCPDRASLSEPIRTRLRVFPKAYPRPPHRTEATDLQNDKLAAIDRLHVGYKF